MEWLFLVAGIAFAVGGIVIAVVHFRRTDRGAETARLDVLGGRLQQMAEQQASAQNQITERLQAQERALAKALDERLTFVASRVNESLERTHEKQATANNQITERLQAQERALAKALDERLNFVTKRVSESLERSHEKQDTVLSDLKERLVRIDAAQKSITELSSQVVGLQDILSNKQARGAFGEVQLRDLVEKALPPESFAWQATIGEGRRVDCLLRLPYPPGPIAIDAKFPLESYVAMRDAPDEAAAVKARRLFKAAVLKHVNDIADKYIVPDETADSALMFLPSEAVYAELHTSFRGVIEESYRRRVWIVSPTTLWATLNTVRAVLMDVRMREQADLIQKEVRLIIQNIDRLDNRVEKLKTHFSQANKDILEISISTGKVVAHGERIKTLELEEPAEALASDKGPRLVAEGGE